MALGRQGERKAVLIVGWVELPRSPGHAFYDRLQTVPLEAGFDGFAEARVPSFWTPIRRTWAAARVGRPRPSAGTAAAPASKIMSRRRIRAEQPPQRRDDRWSVDQLRRPITGHERHLARAAEQLEQTERRHLVRIQPELPAGQENQLPRAAGRTLPRVSATSRAIGGSARCMSSRPVVILTLALLPIGFRDADTLSSVLRSPT